MAGNKRLSYFYSDILNWCKLKDSMFKEHEKRKEKILEYLVKCQCKMLK